MSITLRQLRAVVAVARSGSLGRAAALLHLSQPALTVQIRELELALGVRLFDRDARGAKPTEAGRELAASFGRVMADLDAVIAGAKEVAALRAGVVRVAALPSVSATLLPAALARLRQGSPGIRAIVNDAVALQVGALVKTGAAELGIGTEIDPDPELETTLLFEDRVVAVVPVGHPLAAARGITTTALAQMTLVLGDPESSVRMLFERACAAKGLTVAPAYEATYVSTLIAMVRAGLGVGVLTASTVDPNVERRLRICPIEDPPINRSVMLIRRAGRSNSPAADAFVEALMACEPIRSSPTSRSRPGVSRPGKPHRRSGA